MKTSCEIRLEFWDTTAKRDATVSYAANQTFANENDIVRESHFTPPVVATLEPNHGWPLDGSRSWLPEYPQNQLWGIWSTDLSGPDGKFSTPQTITILFGKERTTITPHSSVGLTFTFVDSVPGEMSVSWLDETWNEKESRTFTPIGLTHYLDCKVGNYYGIRITVRGMQQSGRFFRMSDVVFGAGENLDETRLSSAVMTEEVSPVALKLPINTLKLKFYTPENRFNLLAPEGVYSMIQWRQKLTGTMTIDGEVVPIGNYYLQHAETSQGAVTGLTCMDIIGVLDTISYPGGIYKNAPLPQLLDELLSTEGIDYELMPQLRDIKVSGYLPYGTKRKALMELAFAHCFIVDPTRGDKILMYTIPTNVTSTLSVARKIDHKVTQDDLYGEVEVVSHRYRLNKQPEEVVRSTFSSGTHIVHFDEPVEVKSVTGAKLLARHPNYCQISVTGTPEVVINAAKYVDTQTVYRAKATKMPEGVMAGTKAYRKATLVSPEWGQRVADNLLAYYQLRYLDEGMLLPASTDRAGRMVELETKEGRTLQGFIERMSTDMVGGCLENVQMRGK